MDDTADPSPPIERPALAHELFARHAAAAPDAIAVRFRDRRLTYGELQARANQLAHTLAEAGIGAEARVAVCVEPGLDIAIALVGILAAGAVYVPLDPTYPAARIRAILDDTTPALVVSQPHLIERLGLGHLPALTLDDAALGARSRRDVDVPVHPSQTAYMYCTSGTTGAPKAVMATHANLSAYLQAAHDRYRIDARDVIPAIARFGFSISMFELMSPLVAGGTLLVLEREAVLDPARLARALTGVTLFHAGPSLLKGLIGHVRASGAAPSELGGVRHASTGGDMVPPSVVAGLQAICPAAEVFVIYGCTEIACMGCTHLVPRDPPVTRTYVGKPFANTIVRVVDEGLREVPAGVVGEIVFAGDGVARGYLHRPELTAERFVAIDGQRFYRTGDLGRVSDEGLLEVLGRTDFQIKIRGMRIEVADVEAHLRAAPGVRDGAVAAPEGPGGERTLVAYVVADPGASLAAIRRHMADHVPDSMVPARYVELASLPLNHNGKLDRRALVAVAPAVPPRRSPRARMETALAALWGRLLGVAEVGLDDNFFELGGDSMLALQLQVAVEQAHGVALDGMDILRETLEVLAAICDRALGHDGPRARAPGGTRHAAPELFHFNPRGELFGVLHGGRAEHAALLCVPPGQDQVRASFVVNRLARELAARGIASLRFDLYGCGDSLGGSLDASFARWQRDIADARAELVRRTGATRVTGIGVRLGATLLAEARRRGLALSRLVLWDPVADGAALHAELVRMHRAYVRSLVHLRLRRPQPPRGAVELLGTAYTRTAIGELAAQRLLPVDAPSARWLITSEPGRQAPLADAAGIPAVALDVDCRWGDLARIEDVLPDPGIAKALAALVTEAA